MLLKRRQGSSSNKAGKSKGGISTFFKERDMFGTPIKVNFDNVNGTHNTEIGGFFSMIIYAIIMAMIISKTIRIVTHDNPDLNSVIERDASVLLEDHYLKDMDLQTFYVLRHDKEGTVQPQLPRYRKLLNVYFMYEIADWFAPAGEVYQRFWYLAVKCTPDMFNATQFERDTYGSFLSSGMTCLEKEARETVVIQGDQAAWYTKNLMFMVDKCTNDTRQGEPQCETPEVIDEFVKGLTVANWMLHEQVSWRKFGEKPVD